MAPSDPYLVVVDYDEDTERKRAEYLLDNWDEGEVESIRGLTRIVRGADIEALYDALVAKVPEEQISTYELQSTGVEATASDATLELELDTDAERVDWAMESLLKKRDAIEDEQSGEYAVYTKKGRATVSYDVDASGDAVTLTVDIEGFGEAAAFLRDYFEDELAYML